MRSPADPAIPAAVKAPSPQQGVLWNDVPWIAWNILLFISIYAMNADIPGNPWFVVARVFVGTFIVKLLPPGHLSAFPYSGHFILVALIPYSKLAARC